MHDVSFHSLWFFSISCQQDGPINSDVPFKMHEVKLYLPTHITPGMVFNQDCLILNEGWENTKEELNI